MSEHLTEADPTKSLMGGVCMRSAADAHPLTQLAGGSKVHYFNGGPFGVTQQDVLWFQVAVDD